MYVMDIISAPAVDIIWHQVTDSYRYRVARTEAGYLITARSRDVLGLTMNEQWLHKREDVAMACVHAVIAGHTLWKAMNTGLFTGASAAFDQALEAHNALGNTFDDPPVTGRMVQDVRERLLPEDA